MEGRSNEKRNALHFSLWSDGRTTLGQPVTVRTYEEIVNEFVYADQLGFHGAWASEHHAFEDGYLPAPLSFLAHVAARVEHLHLGTNLLLLPLWPFRVIAEEAAVLDLLSRGRFTLGVGLGYIPHEFAAFSVSRSQRKERMEAGISYLRAAFRGERVSDGENGTLLPVAPQPMQGAHLPIYMGATAEKALERVARLADGFIAAANTDPVETVKGQWSLLRSYLEKYGRNAEAFPLVVGTHLWVSDDPERDWGTFLAPALAYQQGIYARMSTDPGQPLPPMPDPQSFQRANFLVDTPDNVIRRIRAFRAMVPLTEICFWSHPPGVPHEAVMMNLDRLAKDVLPAFR